jgi:hypothetical protein
LGDSLNITPKPPVPKIRPEGGVGVSVGGCVAVGEAVAEAVGIGVIVAVPVCVGGEVTVGAAGREVAVGVGIGVTTKIAPPRLSILNKTMRLIRITVAK